MSTKDFVNQMRDIANEYGNQGSVGFVTQILVEFGFRVWIDDGVQRDPLTFWKQCQDKSEADVIKSELQARVDEQNLNGKMHFTLRVFADKNTLGRDPSDWDTNKFFDEWQWDKKPDGPETCFNLIVDSMDKNKLPFGEKFWGRYELRGNPYYVAQGESGKVPSKKDPTKKFFPSFPLPVEMYANEQVAQDAAKSSGTSTSTTNSQWSDLAVKNYGPDMSGLEKSSDQILDWLEKAKKGVAFNNDTENFPLPVPPTPPNLKVYVAGIYNIEVSDIDLMIPF